MDLVLLTQENQVFETYNSLNQAISLTQYHDNKVDVILYQFAEDIKEYITNVPVIKNWNGDIELKPLLDTLRTMDLFSGRNLYFYHSEISNMDIFCGKDPLPYDSVIPYNDIIQKDDKIMVSIKIKPDETPAPATHNTYHDIRLLQYKTMKAHIDAEEDSDSSSSQNGKKVKTKERTIGEVISLVSAWKKLINGVTDQRTGTLYKFSPESAAKKLGLSQLTLDYYLLQMQCAKQHGFDFTISLNKRFSVIGSFIKLFNTKKDILKSFCFMEHDEQEEQEKTVEKCKRTKKIQK